MTGQTITNSVEVWDIYVVYGGFGIPIFKELVEMATSLEEADNIVREFHRLYSKVYKKRRIAA